MYAFNTLSSALENERIELVLTKNVKSSNSNSREVTSQGKEREYMF